MDKMCKRLLGNLKEEAAKTHVVSGVTSGYMGLCSIHKSVLQSGAGLLISLWCLSLCLGLVGQQ